MSLDVKTLMTASPSNLPAAGGTLKVTFEARSNLGNSRLKADYGTAPNSNFRIVGSSTLAPVAVGTGTFKRFESNDLELRPNPGASPGLPVIVQASVQEVNAAGQPVGTPHSANCTISIQKAPASPLLAAGASSNLGQSLRSFREAAGLSQEAVAQQLQVSRSTVSRVERGQEPSERMADDIRAMIGGSPS